jgi:hypothetical protein
MITQSSKIIISYRWWYSPRRNYHIISSMIFFWQKLSYHIDWPNQLSANTVPSQDARMYSSLSGYFSSDRMYNSLFRMYNSLSGCLIPCQNGFPLPGCIISCQDTYLSVRMRSDQVFLFILLILPSLWIFLHCCHYPGWRVCDSISNILL